MTMTAEFIELLPELVIAAVFGLGSAGLALAGAYIEQFALTTIQSGEMMLGLWAGGIGAVVLVCAYLMATDKFATKLKSIRAAASPTSK